MKFNSFTCGLIAGVGIGYLLAASDKEEIIEGIESSAKTAKNIINEGVKKGKKAAATAKAKANEWEGL